MLVNLRRLKYFWIYSFTVAALIAVKYIIPDGSDAAWRRWTFFIYIPILLLPFISGPALGYIISKKYDISVPDSIKMSIVILIATYLTMCIYGAEYFIKDGLLGAHYNIFAFPFCFPALVMAVLFEITCLIRTRKSR